MPTNSGPPQNLTAVLDDRSVDVSWDAPADDGGTPVTGYMVNLRNMSDWSQTAFMTDQTSFHREDLQYGDWYQVRIQALNAAGASPVAYAEFRPSTLSDEPRNVTSKLGDKSLDIYWDAPEFDGGAPIIEYRVTASPGGASLTVPAESSWARGVTFEGLTNGIEYSFIVTAVNEHGESTASERSAVRAPRRGEDDLDDDTLPDVLEDRAGTNPLSSDTDGDNLSDAVEVLQFTNALSPANPDTDGDGTFDSLEDTDEDGINNTDEVAAGTVPTSADTDHDKLPDGDELSRGTSAVEPDSDSDSLLDGDEVSFGFDPLNAHSQDPAANDGEAPTSRDITHEDVTATVSGTAAAVIGTSVDVGALLDAPGGLTATAVVVAATSGTVVQSLTLPLRDDRPLPSPSSLAPVKWNDNTGTWEFVNNNVSISTADRTVTIVSPELGLRYAIVDLTEWRSNARACNYAENGDTPLSLQIILDNRLAVASADTTGERFTAIRAVLDQLDERDSVRLSDFGTRLDDFGFGHAAEPYSTSDDNRNDTRGTVSQQRALDDVRYMEEHTPSDYGWEDLNWMVMQAEMNPGLNYAEQALGRKFAIHESSSNPYAPNRIDCYQPAILLVTNGSLQPTEENTDPDFGGPTYVPFTQRTDPPVHVLDIGAVDGSDSWLADVAERTGGTYSYVPTAGDLTSWVTAATPQPPAAIDPQEAQRDNDGDGLSNWVEIHGVTAGMRTSRLGLGVPGVFYANPDDADTDDDGLSDGAEIGAPYTAAELGGWTGNQPITVYNVRSDPASEDGDNDGLPDVEELDANWNALNADPDSDGLEDADESDIGTFPTLSDTDSDGFSDLFEWDRIDGGYDPLERNEATPEEQFRQDFALGAFCGDNDVCRRDSIPWLLGNILSGVAIYGDVRDFVAAVLEGNAENQFWIAIGLIPYFGDVGKASKQIIKALGRSDGRFATQLVRLLSRVSQSDELFLASLRLAMPDLVDNIMRDAGSAKIAADILNTNSIPMLKALLAYPYRGISAPSGLAVSYMEKTGVAAQEWAKQAYGNPSYKQHLVATGDGGGRFPDLEIVDEAGDLHIHETKVGYVSGARAIAQISKDAALLGQYATSATWHFFASETTGRIGVSGPVLEQLRAAGIKVVVHIPTVAR